MGVCSGSSMATISCDLGATNKVSAMDGSRSHLHNPIMSSQDKLQRKVFETSLLDINLSAPIHIFITVLSY